MEQGFCIYPRKCSSECETMNQAAKEMLTYKNQLENVKNVISGLNGSGYGNVVNFLGGVINDVESERKSIELLSAVLEQSIQLYEQTEARITDGTVDVNKADDGKDGTGDAGQPDTWDDILAKILSGIGGFRDNIWYTMFESILLKGPLTDNVLKDFGKMLSGTYLSTYWKDGQMYFKLNFDDLTNRQAIEWLEENLGGNWDDYLARNLKNEGFAVFDSDSGILRDMRYWDDITDPDLLKYINGLGELSNLKFADRLMDNFKFFDDFDYSEFADCGKLGKAGKILGTLGTVLTIGGDVVDNFYDTETGEWSFSGNQFADCVCDVVVDVGAGAGSAALGATIGSFFAPPVGTVLGAGVGIAVDFVANVDFFDWNGDGEKDSVVDGVKMLGHGMVDIVETVVDFGSDAIDAIGDWGSDAIDAIVDWGSDERNWLGVAFCF